jgi:hypothetical protein
MPGLHRLVLCFGLAGACAASAAASLDPSEQALQAFVERRALLAELADARVRSKAQQHSDTLFVSGFERGEDDACQRDSDGDGLPDCVETNTGVFVDLWDTGTDPFNPDTDGDGISDGDEVLGTIDGLDLPALGVHPLRRDLLVQYNWFDDDLECGAHSHRPSDAVLARVKAVFADAPLVNADGTTGINLIQDVGEGGVFDGGGVVHGFDPVLPGALDDTFRAIKRQHLADNRRGYFRFVLMPHRYNAGSSSSGHAEVIGDDAIVSLYCLHGDDNVARTILHELGHLLGLQHGGFESCNGKPNYNSLMNYRYQFSGVDLSCNALGDNRDGFSSGARVSLDEHAVDENIGVCGNPAIDWNRNGVLEAGIAENLRRGYDFGCGSGLRVLHDFDDWAHMTFHGLLDRDGALKSIQEHAACGAVPPH